MVEDPSALGECEFKLVPVILCLVGRNDRGYLGNIQMAYAYKLVIYLLLLGLKLHLIRKRLPFASSAYSEMLAERLQTMFGRLYHTENESFHIVLLLFSDLYVDYISRHCKLYEQHSTVNPCKCLAFRCHRFDGDILQYDILLFPSHMYIN